MNATPAICPVCGELVIAVLQPTDELVMDIPPHPDSAFPAYDCPMSEHPMPRFWTADRHRQ